MLAKNCGKIILFYNFEIMSEKSAKFTKKSSLEAIIFIDFFNFGQKIKNCGNFKFLFFRSCFEYKNRVFLKKKLKMLSRKKWEIF